MSTFIPTKAFVNFPPVFRRLLLIGLDAFLLPLAVWFSFWLRLAQPFHSNFVASGSWILLSAPLVGVFLYAFTGQYNGLTRYVGSVALYRLAVRNGLLVLYLSVLVRRLSYLCRLAAAGFCCGFYSPALGVVRFALRDVLLNLRSLHKHQLRVAIYGAGKPVLNWRHLCV